jgi:serine/threonine protein kinase
MNSSERWQSPERDAPSAPPDETPLREGCHTFAAPAGEQATPRPTKGRESIPPSALRAEPAVDDPRIVEALEKYLAAVEAGEKPNRQAYLARHAEIAGALAECLDGLEALQAASSPGRSSSAERGSGGTSADLQPEAPLGDFRIVREIGRGGMGVVYEAVQMSLGRRVALKVLPFAAALDAKQLQRFKNEAQAAAQLHHTNIVPVYAVGVERGVHFYAMQLIEGQNLAALIEELRGRIVPSGRHAVPTPNPSPNPDPSLYPPPDRSPAGKGEGVEARKGEAEPTGPYPLSPPPHHVSAAETRLNLSAQLSTQRSGGSPEFFRAVTRLVVQVAEALDYAHGMGIIHRDIKPANLVVDGRGNVWITDFGLAQFHANVGVTQTGDLVGTLRYMSPEQAGGQRILIDHRTDVYSLGATLYEFLTLRPIFDGSDRQTLLHQIMHEEPRPPRSVDRSIPPELETIVLKAISKVPAERYATARDLADDLHRFLRHEPIRARRATPIQRTRKWLRRHPSVLAAAAVLLVLLTAGSLVSAWLIRGEQDKTRLAYEREKAQFRIARKSVDEIVHLAEKQLAGPHLEGLRMELLGAALEYYQEFIELSREDPDAPQADLTATQDRIKSILGDLSVLQGAGQLDLLAEKAVLSDLQPSSEQLERISALPKRIERQRHESFHDYRGLSPEERQRRFLQLARNNEAAVKGILGPEKYARFKQIALQLRGPRAFVETEVSKELKFTAPQTERIRAIVMETFFGISEGMCHGGTPGEPRNSHEQTLKQANERIQALLTAEQRKRWREMTGEPFNGSVALFRPSPGPFGPRGRFGGPGGQPPRGPER